MFRLPWIAPLSLIFGLSACDGPDFEDGRSYTEEPVLADPALAEPAIARDITEYRRPANRGRRGVVTAGDIDDVLNLAAFQRYMARAAKETGLPRMPFGTPVLAQVVGSRNKPAPGVRYTLRKPGAAEPFFDSYTGTDGRIAVFPQVLGAGKIGAVELRLFAPDGRRHQTKSLKSGQWQRVKLWADTSYRPDFLDLAIVVDTTGSMADEIAFLNKELIGITRAAARKVPGISVRYGLIAYRDNGDLYVVRNSGFTAKPDDMTRRLRALSANGGGDYPEAAAAAMAAGVDLNWRRGNGKRVLLHVTDAPPHRADAGTYLKAARAAAGKDIKIYTLGASGVARDSEFLMRQASAATGGRYVFLTDNSGVGHPHAEPTVSCYRVTKLAGLLTRILESELTGKRQEAKPGQVRREVGTYRNGLCLD